jgi:CBS domain-containing protein
MKNAGDLLIEVPVLGVNDRITNARKIIREEGLREIFVSTGEGELLGMIDISDVLRIRETRSNITVEGFIREAPTILPGDTLETAALAIREKGTNCAVVTDGNRKLLGVLLFSEIFPILISRHEVKGVVRDFMSQGVITVTPEDDLQKISTIITESGISSFPVLQKSKVIGVISRTDILRSGRARTSLARGAGVPVSSLMTTPAITISQNQTVAEAAELLIRHDISILPVIVEGHLTGILDRHDVLKALQFKE